MSQHLLKSFALLKRKLWITHPLIAVTYGGDYGPAEDEAIYKVPGLLAWIAPLAQLGQGVQFVFELAQLLARQRLPVILSGKDTKQITRCTGLPGTLLYLMLWLTSHRLSMKSRFTLRTSHL